MSRNPSPCLENKCFKCCRDTVMPLSRDDIDRITGLGYTDFIDNSGRWPRLTNINGMCFFLEDCKCLIYVDRPEGCRIYPVIINENYIGIDDDCPYPKEFEVKDTTVSALLDLIKRLETEKSSKK